MSRPLHRAARVLLAALALALATAAVALELTFLDVGQGTAVLIESDSGHVALVDAGPADANVLGQLQAMNVARLDLVIATHAHADHIGGMAEVIRAYGPGFYLDNGVPHTSATYQRTLDAAEASGANLLEPARRTVKLGEVGLTILPPAGEPGLGQNDNSLAVLVSYGSFRAMLPGDAEAPAWNGWLERHDDLVQSVDVHLASHHGSRNGDTDAALARLSPRVVIVQSGAGNEYGHPHDEALARYQRSGAHVLRSDQNGRIRVAVESNGEYAVYLERQATTP